jgi:predicted ATPase
VRTLAETGVLVGERRVYRLAQPVDTLQVPTAVQMVLAARIDRLPPEDKRLLQTAAVIGTEVPWPLLQAIAELPEEALRRSLAHLQAAEFLYEMRLFPDLAYTFKHALTHEVAYESLLQARRRALHAGILAALDRLAPGCSAEEVDRLAHHALRGEVWDKAVVYCRRASAKAADHSAHREAVTYCEQALRALQQLPESRATREQAIDLRLDLRTALFALGEHERMRDTLHEAEALALARTHQERGSEAWALRLLGEVAARQGLPEVEPAKDYYRQALSLADELGMRPLQAHCHHGLGTLYAKTGHREQACGELSTAIGLYKAMEMTFWLLQAEAVLAAVEER